MSFSEYQLDKNNIAERDMILKELQDQIEKKERMLIDKKKYYEERAKENEHLEDVKNNYTRFYNKIKADKEEKLIMMQKLHQYMETIKQTEKLLEEQILSSIHEQDLINDEIEKIKAELQYLL